MIGWNKSPGSGGRGRKLKERSNEWIWISEEGEVEVERFGFFVALFPFLQDRCRRLKLLESVEA